MRAGSIGPGNTFEVLAGGERVYEGFGCGDQDEVPCSASEYFKALHSIHSTFIHAYRGHRKDTELKVGSWVARGTGR